MSTAHALLNSIRKAPAGLMLAELLAQHPDVARRTAKRWISQWIDGGQITAIGEGRARRAVSLRCELVFGRAATSDAGADLCRITRCVFGCQGACDEHRQTQFVQHTQGRARD